LTPQLFRKLVRYRGDSDRELFIGLRGQSNVAYAARVTLKLGCRHR